MKEYDYLEAEKFKNRQLAAPTVFMTGSFIYTYKNILFLFI